MSRRLLALLAALAFAPGVRATPEISVRAAPGLTQSTITVTVKTPGAGVSACDVYIALGDSPESLGAEEKIGDGVGIGAVCVKTIASPTTPFATCWRVRAVDAENASATVSGVLDTEVKWYFDPSAKRLTNAVGWKIAASKTTINGVEGYNIDGADAIKAAPKDENDAYLTELDLTGLKNTGLDVISLGAHVFRSNGGLKITLTKLHLPETIIKITGNAFVTTSGIRDFEPHEFPDLISIGSQNGMPTALFADPVLKFTNPGFTTCPQQIWQAAGDKAYHFGYGLTAFGNYAFDSSGATDIYLTGDAVPTTGTDWHRNTKVVRINVPIYSDDWNTYAEASAAEPTAAQQTAYATAFPDGRALWKVGKTGQTPNYGALYLSKWAPDDYCRNAVHVRGNVAAGDVSPAYGKNKYVAQTVVCSAPAATTFENVDYDCQGYVIEALGADGWGAPVTNLGVNSFTLARDGETSYRITWLWAEAGFALNVAQPDSGVVGSVGLSPERPASGSYAPNTVVSVSATIGAGYTGPFDHWEGDVPEGHEADMPLEVTMNQARNLVPVFASQWIAVDGYATTRMTDGYWTLKIAESNGEIALNIDCMNGVTHACPIDLLDLRKGVSGDRVITQIGAYAMRTGSNPVLHDLRLPDTLRSIGSEAFSGQAIRSIDPLFPSSLTNLGSKCFGSVLFTNGVSLLNKDLVAFPGQFFGSPWYYRSLEFGTGLKTVADFAFDGYSGAPNDVDIIFNGDVPTFGSSILRGKPNKTVRFFFPVNRRGLHPDWDSFCAANVTALSEAETTAYYTKYGEDAPAPVGLWLNQYVIRFPSAFDKIRPLVILVR